MYRQSVLGYVWAFLPVLAVTGVFLFLHAGGTISTTDETIPYPVYLLVGSILWQVFVDAVQGPLKVISASRAMLVKINFPRESLIIAAVLITLFNFIVRLAILVPALVFFATRGQYVFSPSSLLLFPVGVFGVVLLGYTIGILLTPIGILYKDIQLGVGIVLQFWMFLSPVVFMLSDKKDAVRTAALANPASHVIDTARSWLVGIPAELAQGFWIVTAAAFCFLLLGWLLYRISLPHVIARLGM